MTKRIAIVIISGFIALQMLGGCAAPNAGIGQAPQETTIPTQSAEPTQEAAIPTKTRETASPEQTTAPTPTASAKTTGKPMSAPTATQKPETGNAQEQPDESKSQPTTGQDKPQSPAPVAAAPDPTCAVTPALTVQPTPEPTPQPTETQEGGAKCHTCGNIIPDSELYEHMKYHAIHDGGGGYDTK